MKILMEERELIKNIIFDIGGVLFDYNPKTYLDKLGFDIEKQKELNNIIFKSPLFKECLNGNISMEELIYKITKNNMEYENEIFQILDSNNLHYMMPPINKILRYYNTLRSGGYNIYLLSNITLQTYEYIDSTTDVIKNANGGIYSCFEHVTKPNRKIFDILVDRYSLIPKECVYIDDSVRNIKVGNEVGFNSLLYENFKKLKVQIAKILNS